MRDDMHLDISAELLELLSDVWKVGMMRFEGARAYVLAVYGDATLAGRVAVMRWEGAAWLVVAKVQGPTVEDFMAQPLTGPAMFDIAMSDPRRRVHTQPGQARVCPISFCDVHARLGLMHPLDKLTEAGGLPLIEYLTDRTRLRVPVGRIDARLDGEDSLRLYGASARDDDEPKLLEAGMDRDRLPSSFAELARWSGRIDVRGGGHALEAVLIAVMARVMHWGGLTTFSREGWTAADVRTRLLVDEV